MRSGTVAKRSRHILVGRGGFSLVEVLVALGISSVVAWAIPNLQINQGFTSPIPPSSILAKGSPELRR